MAVYEGARPRTIALPARPRIAEGPTLGRRRVRGRGPCRSPAEPSRASCSARSSWRSCWRSSRWPSRSAVSATGLDIGRLELDRERLDDAAADLRLGPQPAGREPAIRKLAIDAGLGQLADPIVLPAR